MSDKATRIIVSDAPGTSHAEGLKVGIAFGYNEPGDKQKYPDVDISNEIEVVSFNMNECYDRIRNDQNIIALARSTSGVQYYVKPAREFYPRVQFFIPMGANIFQETFIFSEPAPPIIVTSGCGDDEGRNNTWWGNGMEFWDGDWTWVGGTDASSFSNGFITGKMLRVRDELVKLGIPEDNAWWKARYLCRMGAYRTEPNRPKDENGKPVLWHKQNGYGRINAGWPLHHFNAGTYTIPTDPYLEDIKLGEVGSLNAVLHGQVNLTCTPVENAVEYEFWVNGVLEGKSKSPNLTVILKTQGKYMYKYRARSAAGEYTEFSEPKEIYYVIEKHRPTPIKDIDKVAE